METKHYSEYAAWLQRGSVRAVPPARIDGAVGIVADELRLGLERLGCVVQDMADYAFTLKINGELPAEGYRLSTADGGFLIEGADKSGVLYGVYNLLMRLAAGEELSGISATSAPAVAHRVINHWDNMDGNIERGYAGRSVLYEGGNFCYDPERMRDYARLMASVGLNVISINNVNVSRRSSALITEELLPEVKKLADIFRPFGVRIALSVSFDSPVLQGGLVTADPLLPEVAAFWERQTKLVYDYIPDFAGYLIKADSEFNGGPAALGRTQADGANMLARTIKPYGGVIYWRCFIYNCLQDWRDTVTDRPKAAYDTFKPLDGMFDDNVILQVKNGPSDFQVREPLSPLFGAMTETPMSLEVQITQEYTGHQIDLYNLAVHWEEILTSAIDDRRALCDLFGDRIKATAAVVNVGRDMNWTGHTLAQCNLFAYGSYAWNPYLTAADITERWVRLTFGGDKELNDTIYDMMMRSRSVYEKYNSPLGLGWMVNPHGHYGPSPEGYEFAKWGTYHRADHLAIGIDRTPSGTGYTSQYHPAVAAHFENIETCPEEIMLYFHRLPYAYVLKSGETLLQYIYDTHFEGAEDVEGFIKTWESLSDKLPEEVYKSVRERLAKQLVNAYEWRDVINTYFFRLTGIPDSRGRKIYP